MIHPDQARLPDATRVGVVHLQVADLGRSLDYYGRVLGFLHQQTGQASAVLTTPDGRELIALHERPGARPAPRRGAFGLYHFAVLLPTRDALGRFAGHIAQARVPVGTADHRVSEALYLTDPDGLGIEVYADRPRSSWKSRGRELVMTSDPLDLRSLLLAGGRIPWAGIPAGTTIGHMHLHVGSLADAEAFYHQALGLDKVVWSYPGALFLSAGGYHHHLGVNTWSPGPAARDDEARLLEWQLVVPTAAEATEVAARVSAAGWPAVADGTSHVLTDPWGTSLRVLSEA